MEHAGGCSCVLNIKIGKTLEVSLIIFSGSIEGWDAANQFFLRFWDELSKRKTAKLCYFFCDEKIDSQRTGANILRCLLHQIFEQEASLVEYAVDAFEKDSNMFEHMESLMENL
jgi:hypothetical protein